MQGQKVVNKESGRKEGECLKVEQHKRKKIEIYEYIKQTFL